MVGRGHPAPRRRGRPGVEEDLPAQIRAIVSRPLSIPQPPRQTLPKIVALVVVLLVALAVFATIWHQRTQGPGTNAPSIPAVNSQRGETPSANPPPVHTFPRREPETKADPGAGTGVKYGIPDTPKTVRGDSGNSRHGREKTTVTPAPSSTQLPSGINDSPSTSKEPVASTGPKRVLPTPEKDGGPQDVTVETATTRGATGHAPISPATMPQRTLTPEQKREAGIPYDTASINSTAQTAVLPRRTLTPAEKQRLATSSGVTPGPDSPAGMKTGAHSVTPPVTRPRADSRVPLLPPPPDPDRSSQ